MMDILTSSIARAGGIDVLDKLTVVERPGPRRSILESLARAFGRGTQAFSRWHAQRSTYLTLQQLDDRILRDIGLERGMLSQAASGMAEFRPANDNEAPMALSALPANDNDNRARAV